VTTTGMSAPPIEAVVCAPSKEAEAVAAAKEVATPAASPADNADAPARPVSPARPRLIAFFPGSASGALGKCPASLPYATADPVSVMAPITVPATVAAV